MRQRWARGVPLAVEALRDRLLLSNLVVATARVESPEQVKNHDLHR